MGTRAEGQGQAGDGIDAKPGTVWVKPGIIGRVRDMKGEETLRHATLQDIEQA
jgi:bifunctional non-homologous end joining protein LigD